MIFPGTLCGMYHALRSYFHVNKNIAFPWYSLMGKQRDCALTVFIYVLILIDFLSYVQTNEYESAAQIMLHSCLKTTSF